MTLKATIGRLCGATPAPDGEADIRARRLAGAIAEGDEAAFAELYDLYQGRLFRLVLVLSRGDEEAAREVVQSAMLTAAAKLRSVEGEAHLWHWLARVASQHLGKIWRQRQRESDILFMAELPDTVPEAEPASRLAGDLEAALAGLEEDERRLLGWFYREQLGCQEIALRTDSTAKAVSSRLERIRAKLRSWMLRRLADES